MSRNQQRMRTHKSRLQRLAMARRARQQSARKLLFESLEDRRVLATIIVPTDFGTIQAAVNDAGTNAGDTIQINSGTYNESVDISGGPGTLTFLGNDTGGGLPVIAGTVAGPTFHNTSAATASFTFDSLVIENANNATDEYGIRLRNITGNIEIKDSTFTNVDEDGINIENTNAGVITTVTISGNTMDNLGAPLRDGIMLETDLDSEITATITSNTITTGQNAIELDPNDSSTLDVTISGGTLSGVGTPATINTITHSTATVDLTVDGVTISSTGGDGVNVQANDSTMVTAEITGNTFTSIGSGANDEGVRLAGGSGDSPTVDLLVDGNTFGTSGSIADSGVLVDGNNATGGVFDITVTNNDFAKTNSLSGGAAQGGVHLLSAGATFNVELIGNTVSLPAPADPSTTGFLLDATTGTINLADSPPVGNSGPNTAVGEVEDNNTYGGTGSEAVVLGNVVYVVPSDTTVTLDGADLLVQDTDGGDTDDTLTVSTNGTTNVVINDPNNLLTTDIAGASGNFTNTITVPLSAFTGDIIVDTLGGDDTLTVDFSTGNFTREIDYRGGTQNNSPNGDTLALSGGGTFALATYVFDNANDGSIDITGNQTINYTGLEPITSTITATDVTLDYSTAAETITVTNPGGGQTTVNSTAGEVVTFNNPSGTLTINAGDTGDDTIDVNGLASSYPANIILDGEGGADTININAAVGLGAGESLTAQNADTINLPNTVSDVSTSGAGTVSLTADRNIALSAGSSITTAAGNVTLLANAGGTATGNFRGVLLTDADITTGGGAIFLTGTAGDTGGAGNGILLESGSSVSTSGAGNITLTGTGGTAANAGQHGVVIRNSSSLSSLNGAIDVTGLAGGTAGASGTQEGIIVNGSSITSTGSGAVSLDGTGGTATAGTIGVHTFGAGATISAGSGGVSIEGTKGTATTDAVNLFGTAISASSGGLIEITATGAMSIIGGSVSGDSTIDLDATEDISISTLTTTGEVQITSGGAISENTSGEGANITANAVALRASTGIGDAATDNADIDIAADDLAATTATGDISISDNATLDITTVDGLIGVSITAGVGTDDILIREGVSGSADEFDVSQPVTNSGAGAITLFADGNSTADELNIFADITAGLNGNILIVSYDDVDFNASPTVSTTGTGEIGVHAGRDFTHSGGLGAVGSGGSSANIRQGVLYSITTAGGDITIDAPVDVNLQSVDAGAGTAIIEADTDGNNSGQIKDQLAGEAANITAAAAALRSAGGIGSADNLNTSISTLSANNSSTGNIQIANSVGGLITIGTVDGLDGVFNNGGTVNISNASPLTVADDVTSSGDITLTASDSAGTGDDLTVNAVDTAGTGMVEIESTGGDVTLNAGDDLLIDNNFSGAWATVTAAVELTLNGDTGGAIDAAGSTMEIFGEIVTGTTGEINGGPNIDVIELDPEDTTGSYDINAAGDDDTYFVRLTRLGAQVNFDDTGGTDDLTIAGNDNANVFEVDGNHTQITAAQRANYTAALDTVNVNGLDGNDTFNVSPPTSTEVADLNIFGGDPVAPASPGDVLNFATPVGQTATLTNPGPDSGTIETTGGFQDVDFDEIERLNFGGSVVVDGSGEDDLLVIDATGATAGTFQLTTDVDGSNGGPFVGPIVGLSGVTDFTFNGFAGDDILRINNPLGGGLFAPSGGTMDGVFYNGGADSDLLQNLGGSGSTGTYDVGPGADEGTLTAIDGTDTQTITFTGLEPIEHTVTLSTFSINASSGADTINIVNGPLAFDGSQTVEVNFDGDFELIQFANKTTVNVNGRGGDDVIDVAYTTNADGLSTLNVNGNGDADDFSITGSTPTAAVTNLNGNAGEDDFTFSDAVTLTGVIDGGADDDFIDWSAVTGPLTVTLFGLGSTDGFRGDQTTTIDKGTASDGFDNIDDILGTTASDTLVGPNLVNHWSIDDLDVGRLIASGFVGALGKPTPAFTPAAGQQDLAWDSFEILVGAITAADRFDFADGAVVSDSIDGRGGNDSLDARDYTTPVTVDLAAGTTNLTGAIVPEGPGNSSIENAFGGDAADAITGDLDDNILGDGFGDDTLDGAEGNDRYVLEPGASPTGGASADVVIDISGNDTLDFSCAIAAVMVDMDLLGVALDVLPGISGDQLLTLTRNSAPSLLPSAFENVIGSPFPDIIDIDPLSTGGDVPENGPPVLRNVDGGLPASGSPGDTLNFDASGQDVLDTGFSLTATGVGVVTYQSIETVNSFNQQPRIIDNGDAGFSYQPNLVLALNPSGWTEFSGTGHGYGDDYVGSDNLSGQTATWTFDGLTPGRYLVSTTWPTGLAAETDVPFEVFDDLASLGAPVVLDQTIAPDDFSDLGGDWENIGVYTITSHTLVVQTTDLVLAQNTRVFADAVRVEPLGPGPELTVELAETAPALTSRVHDSITRAPLNSTIGNDLTRTFMIRNDGTSALAINGVMLDPASAPELSLTSSVPASLAPGASATFDVTLDASQFGDFDGAVWIFSNDVDENVLQKPGVTGIVDPLAGPDVDPFTIELRGVVNSTTIIDDGDTGFAAPAFTTGADNSAFQGDTRFKPADGNGDEATWTFSGLPDGTYRVSATWPADLSNNEASEFTVNDGTSTASVFIDQQIAPDDLTADGAVWEDLGGTSTISGVNVYTLTGGALEVKLLDTAGTDPAKFAVADAIRVERIFDPDLLLEVNPEVADDTGLVDFGATFFAAPVSKVFTITNNGPSSVDVTQPLSVPAGFTLTEFNGAPPTSAPTPVTLASGADLEFTIRFDAGALGRAGGEVTLVTTDPDENLLNFQITAEAIPAVAIIDNDNDAPTTPFDATPGMFYQVAVGSGGGGFGADVHWNQTGTNNSATWTFDLASLGLPTTGWYQVSAAWTAQGNRASDAPFSIFDDTVLEATIDVNQQEAPNDFFDQGADWEVLGAFHIGSGTIVVTLTDDADSFVIADAIRIEQMVAPEIEVTDITGGGAVDIDNREDTVDFGVIIKDGAAPTRNFELHNFGFRPLALGPVSLPSGYSVVGLPSSTIPANGSVTVTLALDTSTGGIFAGTVSFATDDLDENPFEVDVTGEVVDFTVGIIDNGDPGYAEPGNFITFAKPTAFQSDQAYNATAGGPEDTATWTFTNLQDGLYSAAATWTAQSNLSPNTLYRLYDGTTAGTLVGTAIVNQIPGPVGFSDAGFTWNPLGEFRVTSNSATIELSDINGGFVFADAIRLEKITGPEADVTVGGASILSSAATTIDLGTTTPGTASATTTFTIRNLGTDPLTVGAITPPAGFDLTSGGGGGTLAAYDGAPGGADEATFTLRISAGAAGAVSGLVSFATNDTNGAGNENPYQFTVTGQIVADKTIIDDGDTGYSAPAFISYGGIGFQGDVSYNAAGTGADTATWTFSGLTAGTYQVAATWAAGGNRATDAPYTVSGVTAPGTFDINQQLAPNDFSDEGVFWETLGTTFTLTGTTLTVTLTDDANGFVIADAVRIERLGPLAAEAPATSNYSNAPLTDAQLAPAINEAISFWSSSVTARELDVLRRAQVRIADLPGNLLGGAAVGANIIYLDATAAGYGWSTSTLGGADLLHVVSHELGHLLGHPDLDAGEHAGELMAGTLTVAPLTSSATSAPLNLRGPLARPHSFARHDDSPNRIAGLAALEQPLFAPPLLSGTAARAHSLPALGAALTEMTLEGELGVVQPERLERRWDRQLRRIDEAVAERETADELVDLIVADEWNGWDPSSWTARAADDALPEDEADDVTDEVDEYFAELGDEEA